MTDPTRQSDALLTEHFQYTPLSLIDDIINAVNTIIYQAIEALENGLLQIPSRSLGFSSDQSSMSLAQKENPEDKTSDSSAEIENGVHQLETLLESTVDKAFDQFEIYTLRNILTIPDNLAPWMRLGHYENLQLPIHPSAPTPESILLLRRKLQETKKLNHALRSTHTRNASIMTQLNTFLSPSSTTSNKSLAFLTSPTDPAIQALNLSFSADSKTLTTNAQFATSQLPALRELVAQLRPKVQGMSDGSLGGKVDWEGKREERRAYIEGGARRIVGGSAGEEVGGERSGREEVEGLESVVGGMEGVRRNA